MNVQCVLTQRSVKATTSARDGRPSCWSSFLMANSFVPCDVGPNIITHQYCSSKLAHISWGLVGKEWMRLVSDFLVAFSHTKIIYSRSSLSVDN